MGILGYRRTPKVTSGLVAHWKFEDNLLDSIGTYNGTKSNAHDPLFISGVGKVGKAMNCPYPIHGIEFTEITLTDFTVSFWYKHNVNLSASMFGKYVDNTKLYGLSSNYLSSQWYGIFGMSGATTMYTPLGLSQNVWYHITITAESGNAKLYVNGNHTTSGTGYSGISMNRIGYFGYSSEGGNSFDDFRVYNRAITATEVLDVYKELFLRLNKYRGFSPPTSGMVLHLDAANPASYPGTGLTWYDLSPEGNNAALDATNPPVHKGRYFNFLGSASNKATITDDPSLNFGTGDFTILNYSEWTVRQGSGNSILYKGARYDANTKGWLVTSGANGIGADLFNVLSSDSSRHEIQMFIDTYPLGVFGIMRRSGTIYTINNGVVSLNFASALDISSSGVNLLIGYNPTYSAYWTGRLFNVLIYNRGLTNDEITHIKNTISSKILNH